jgi:dTMP kinase
MPNLTLLFDLDPKIGLNRITKHDNREMNRLDVESLGFHEAVREGYREVIKRYPNRIHVIDASKTQEEVTKEVLNVLKKTLGPCMK